MNNVFRKTANEIESFGIDWTKRLATPIAGMDDTISTSNWGIVPSGALTEAAKDIDLGGLRTTIKVSGGTDGVRYTLTNTVVTAKGRTLDEEIFINVRD